MRRADRLFRIVQLLRRRRTVVTAAQIADKLEISERTVYRDIRDLIQAGTPIDGEAGVGYRLQPGYDLPPLMFDREEIQALVLGARIVAQFGDPALARASESILSKVAGVLPKELEPLLADTRLFVPKTRSGARVVGGARRRARGARRAAAAAREVREREGRRDRADRASARPVLLGQDVDARRLVRDAHRLPQLPPRSHRRGDRSASGSKRNPAARCATCSRSTARQRSGCSTDPHVPSMRRGSDGSRTRSIHPLTVDAHDPCACPRRAAPTFGPEPDITAGDDVTGIASRLRRGDGADDQERQHPHEHESDSLVCHHRLPPQCEPPAATQTIRPVRRAQGRPKRSRGTTSQARREPRSERACHAVARGQTDESGSVSVGSRWGGNRRHCKTLAIRG